jgi:hypothetical protein
MAQFFTLLALDTPGIINILVACYLPCLPDRSEIVYMPGRIRLQHQAARALLPQ